MRFFLTVGREFLVDKGAFTRTTKIVGNGGFAFVYEGVFDSKPIAVKYCPDARPEEMLRLISEINTLIRAKSKHVVKILGIAVIEIYQGQFEVLFIYLFIYLLLLYFINI